MRKIALSIVAAALIVPAAAQARTQVITIVNHVGAPHAYISRLERALRWEAGRLRHSWHTPKIRFGPGGWPLIFCMGVPTGCGGFHTWKNGRPEAVIGVGHYPFGTYDSLSASHELLEMLADPGTLRRLDGLPLEVCDPVDTLRFTRDGVWLSDFVTPLWFRPPVSAPYAIEPLDFMRVLAVPRDASDGFIWRPAS